MDNICGVTGKKIPLEDMGRCNNAEGCDDCPHGEDEVAGEELDRFWRD